MSEFAFPSTTSQVDTAARFPLGYIAKVPAKGSGTTADRGQQEWIYVFNDEPTDDFAEGMLIMFDTASVDYGTIITTGAVSPQRIVGVAQHAIAAGSYGFILRKGVGNILCDGNVTADIAVCPDANAGQATDVNAVTDAAFGVAAATDAGAASLVAAHLNCTG